MEAAKAAEFEEKSGAILAETERLKTVGGRAQLTCLATDRHSWLGGQGSWMAGWEPSLSRNCW